jgi:DNA helicase-2/ATP-dependent DNA helicase PcrA
VTPNHICFARLGTRGDVHYVYLMYRHDQGYRIGIAVGARADGYSPTLVNGLQVRVNQEHADKVWILRVCSTRSEAVFYENWYAFEYGIPTTIFHVAGRGPLHLTQSQIDRLFAAIDTRSRAARLMDDLGLFAEYPHYRPQGLAGANNAQRMTVHLTVFGANAPSLQAPWYRHRVWLNTTSRVLEQQVNHNGMATRPGRSGTWRIERSYKEFARTALMAEQIAKAAGIADVARWAALTRGDKFAFTPAAHLHPTMIVPVWEDGAIVEDEIIAVEPVDYDGFVYDLDVRDLHNYIANGIVTHNSIYGWRGATIRNILEFETAYPAARVIKLEQNYRSTKRILQAADAVIAANQERREKQLWTLNGEGEQITVRELYDEQHEAQYVVQEIQRLIDREGYRPSDFAVLYRTNAQSQPLEQACVRYGLDYQLIGGTRFYERREIKDVLALLRLIVNPHDDVSLRRVADAMPVGDGLGDKTWLRLESWAREAGLSVAGALAAWLTPGSARVPPLTGRAAQATRALAELLDRLRARHGRVDLVTLYDEALAGSGYGRLLQEGTEPERWENVLQLRAQLARYADLPLDAQLMVFLEEAALVAAVDELDEGREKITLITLHAAKGLEFPVVFIVGAEEGLLPHARALGSQKELEEERRLAFVGITRARQRLYLTHAGVRSTFTGPQPQARSQFLAPLDALVEPGASVRRPPRRPVAPPARFGTTRPAPARPGPAWGAPPAPAPRPAATGWPADDGQQAELVAAIRPGDRVRHATFGAGRVLSVKPARGDVEVTVDFAGKGVKKLLASLANLTRG